MQEKESNKESKLETWSLEFDSRSSFVSSFCVLLVLAAFVGDSRAQPADGLRDAFKTLTRNTEWKTVDVVDVGFDTYHPQGFARAGDFIFLSSVEVTERTRPYAEGNGQYDRSTGAGTGHIFKMDLQGRLLDHIEIGRDSVYHPGGIDYDGEAIWAPVAEYRPHSSSIIYRIDPVTMTAEEVFSYPDHIGGIVHDVENGRLWGVSWGSRVFYSWNEAQLEGMPFGALPEAESMPNPSHYIDYQDCQYAGGRYAICSGLASIRREGMPPFRLGGVEMIDLSLGLPVHQTPLPFWTESGLPYTQNPLAMEIVDGKLRVYAMPEDRQSRLFVLETDL